MNAKNALASGLAGAVVVNAIHETVRHFSPKAPRMDLMGKQAVSKLMDKMGKATPSEGQLYGLAMAGDLLSNSIYYSLAGLNNAKNPWLRGALLGLAAGFGAVLLPKKMGLKEEYINRTVTTKIMTIGLYLFGGIVAAAVTKLLDEHTKD